MDGALTLSHSLTHSFFLETVWGWIDELRLYGVVCICLGCLRGRIDGWSQLAKSRGTAAFGLSSGQSDEGLIQASRWTKGILTPGIFEAACWIYFKFVLLSAVSDWQELWVDASRSCVWLWFDNFQPVSLM